MQKLALLLALLFVVPTPALPQPHASWRAATSAELEGVLPARAPVEKERIETEMRTATGIVNDRGQIIAAVVLITAGYSADGKYSHYFLAQTPVTIGENMQLPAGHYVVGWKRSENGLSVTFFEAASGKERGTALAKPQTGNHRVESFRIFAPSEHSFIQIGRYTLPYSVGR